MITDQRFGNSEPEFPRGDVVNLDKLICVRNGLTGETRKAWFLRDHMAAPGMYDVEFGGTEWTVSEDDVVAGTNWKVENRPDIGEQSPVLKPLSR